MAHRASRLNNLFYDVLRGKLFVTAQNKDLFLEAIVLQPDAAECLNKLLGSPQGLPAVQAAVRFDLTPRFFDGLATKFLKYLQAPEVSAINGGKFLQRVLTVLVDPPIFWVPFSQAFQIQIIGPEAQQCCAWIIYQFISLPGFNDAPYRSIIEQPGVLDGLLKAPQLELRTIGQKIKHVLSASSLAPTPDGGLRPGGRHDNDFEDLRQIAIIPTSDEIKSLEPAFLRSSAIFEDPHNVHDRVKIYRDQQFRLLREDMVAEMREELQVALGEKKGKHRGLKLEIVLQDMRCDPDPKNRRDKWCLEFKSTTDLPQFGRMRVKAHKRITYLQENKKLLMHQSLACLISGKEILGFVTINRDEDLLAKNPPILLLHPLGPSDVIGNLLLRLKTLPSASLIQINTAVFSFEPILKSIQHMKRMPLSEEVLLWDANSTMTSPSSVATSVVSLIRSDPKRDLKPLLNTAQSIHLDASQARSLLAGLTQKVSLIQGPPGTGKSFIGALLAKIIHDSTTQRILVVCYTNHALDQFLEDLMQIGIPAGSMVRLGGKSTTATEHLSLYKQKSVYKLQRSDWTNIDQLKVGLRAEANELQRSFKAYAAARTSYQDIMDFVEFNHPTYHAAFTVPKSDDGMIAIGSNGKAIDALYLLIRWIQGKNAGRFVQDHQFLASSSIKSVWGMSADARKAQLAAWQDAIIREHVSSIVTHGDGYNSHVASIDAAFSQSDSFTLRNKRIIGCTTTAAAKYNDILQVASPNVLLVEEAGEILESHVLTALGSSKEQLILIGDHKQLRPKVNDYKLTVEKGDGYDLNVSLFERLVLKGYPHETLSQQHRMRPEIAKLIRQLTYPDLVDAPSVQNRPDTRGLQDNVIFVSHEHPEDDIPDVMDRLATSSKQNTHEANLVLKIVRYLAQQGYGTDHMVILTPYLGQLHKLVSMLRADSDPILNDLDSHDLVRAGLVSPAAAKLTKKSIRLATIDNYQGEESEIVIASLTRSNSANDVGFMFAPERLNVLLSRARNTLILIGNAQTFMASRKGGPTWAPLFKMLTADGHIYNGLPVQCQQHPQTKKLLINPEDFDNECPDGGCKEPCGTKLSCGLHLCPSKCHQLYDHSKMKCLHPVYTKCAKGHEKRRKCHEPSTSACSKCDEEARIAERKRQREYEMKQIREAEETKHTRDIAELEGKIVAERQKLRDEQVTKDRKNAIQQKSKELQDTISLINSPTPDLPSSPLPKTITPVNPSFPRPPATHMPLPPVPTPSILAAAAIPASSLPEPSPFPKQQFTARDDWLRRKSIEGVRNDAIDDIMEMTGLETVKEQVLKIVDKIDTAARQNTSLKGENFNVVFQGNPGTGKTTVARHYGKFLSSVGVLSGNSFVETTGSRLANDGVPGAKKQIEELVNSGGGTLFVDEAYQLTSAHNFQGSQIMDFLLAELLNHFGVIVFIFAGYTKQMESFFEHNPGLPSRVPYAMVFEDYDDVELLKMLAAIIKKQWQGRMKVADGDMGLYCRIAIRRLGCGRGREGFGNVRDLHNMFAKIRERQAARLRRERSAGHVADDFLLQAGDLIGPDPSLVLKESKAWTKLQNLIGLEAVKSSIRSMFSLIKTNYERELQEKRPVAVTLNRVFLGSPGTGKTSVAQLYGEILADMGLLSNGEVVLKNPADFIGSALGQSEANTKAILAATVGKVLIIDEAYMLYGGSGGTNNATDSYKSAVIDTIVAEVQNVPGDNRCVLLLGYKEAMDEMFQNVNQGLSRRFAIDDAFYFDDFTDPQLLQILDLKLKQQDLGATGPAKNVAIDVLSRARTRPNFGNAGEVENLLSKAKSHYQSRTKGRSIAMDIIFEPEDFDPDFDRHTRASRNLKELFADVVGSDHIVDKLDGYQRIAQLMKSRGLDPRTQIPTAFVFKGPPGEICHLHRLLSSGILIHYTVQALARPLSLEKWVKYSSTWASYRRARLSNVQLQISSGSTSGRQGQRPRSSSRKLSAASFLSMKHIGSLKVILPKRPWTNLSGS
ncbi:hypothetical protein HGRIS_007097 [Hohenbuehelia grisea]|uniref:AAA+ ATPase domain-containing protein n=1 Tax=Hohenbuehelia grisea TaxID=104357 RepID=A0ABR3JB08_9AGAR